MRIGFFVTCLADLMRPRVAFAAIKLLKLGGAEVVVPSTQTCCGQPAYNSGERAGAMAVARKLLSHFHVIPEPIAIRLTERETEVLRLIARGLTSAEVARLLNISVNTVPSYVKEIYRKLNVSSRAEAALTARNMGLA